MSGVSRSTSRSKKTTNGQAAVDALTHAAGTALAVHKDDITECLLKNIKKGHAASAKLLVDLATAHTEETGKGKRRRSRANELAIEPTWSGEASEAEAGICKPE